LQGDGEPGGAPLPLNDVEFRSAVDGISNSGAVGSDASGGTEEAQYPFENVVSEIQNFHSNAQVFQMDKLVPIRILADGNCFFRALERMIHQMHALPITWQEISKLVTKEFTENKDAYRAFIVPPPPSTATPNYDKELGKYIVSMDGPSSTTTAWDSLLGDAVPMAAANALGAVLVIHHDAERSDNRPPDIILPLKWNAAYPIPIDVHQQACQTHYEALELYQTPEFVPPQSSSAQPSQSTSGPARGGLIRAAYDVMRTKRPTGFNLVSAYNHDHEAVLPEIAKEWSEKTGRFEQSPVDSTSPRHTLPAATRKLFTKMPWSRGV
jgi:hypothetical protein